MKSCTKKILTALNNHADGLSIKELEKITKISNVEDNLPAKVLTLRETGHLRIDVGRTIKITQLGIKYLED